MKAIILAAGEGKRLSPLTKHRPKAMVSLRGQSMLERQLSQLQKLGLNEVIVVTGYCREIIEKCVSSKKITTVFNEQFHSTNMVYSLSKTLHLLNSEQNQKVLILYGDIAYADQHLQTLVNSHTDAKMTVLGNSKWLELWSSRLEEPLSDAETFIFDDNMRLIEIGKKPENLSQVQAQYMGMVKVSERYLHKLLSEYIKVATTNKIRNVYMTDLIQKVIDTDSVKVELVAGCWIEMDSIDDYQLYSDPKSGDFGVFV